MNGRPVGSAPAKGAQRPAGRQLTDFFAAWSTFSVVIGTTTFAVTTRRERRDGDGFVVRQVGDDEDVDVAGREKVLSSVPPKPSNFFVTALRRPRPASLDDPFERLSPEQVFRRGVLLGSLARLAWRREQASPTAGKRNIGCPDEKPTFHLQKGGMCSIFVPCREGPSRCPIPSAPHWPPRHVALCQSRQNRRAEKDRARVAAAEPISRERPGAGGHGPFGSRASHADFISRSPSPQAMGLERSSLAAVADETPSWKHF